MPIIKTITRSIRAILATLYLVLIILTIPLAFDVGGVNCGLAYSLTTLVTYFILTTIRILVRKTKYFQWISIIYYCQHFFIPSLLTYFLSYYSHENIKKLDLISSSGSGSSTSTSTSSKFNPVMIWRLVLINSTPIFTVLEGVCSLLLIQAMGQTMSWLTIYKSDSWLIISLIGSGSVITASFYFLYRIYVLPFTIDMFSASLLGSILTTTMGLGLFGIISGKGSMIESSLLFAYIVKCIYETFPILSEAATKALANLFTLTTQNLKKEIPKIPPSILNPISEVIPFITSTLPSSFKGVWKFLIMAIKTLTLPLLLNLAYRIGVFYAATKIIPSLYQSASYPLITPPKTPQPGSRQVSTTSLSTFTSSTTSTVLDQHSKLRTKNSFRLKPPHHQPPSVIIRLIYAYSPCLIIAVYTHLMLSYNGELGTELKLWPLWSSSNGGGGGDDDIQLIVHPWQFWNWINMGTTLILYAAELLSNDNSSGGGNSLTSHWKVE